MDKKLALPTEQQVTWHDMEVGMFIHWAPNVYQEEQHDQLTTPIEDINPEGFDAEKWVQCALGLGAKYIVLVAKHGGGFCLWQTDTTPYSIKNIKWKDGKADIVKEVSDACKKHGIKLGVYLSPSDKYMGAKVGGRCENSEKQRAYDVIYRQQLTELLSLYGEMVEVWFDGNTHCEIGDILEKYAPNAMVFQSQHATIRWVGNEDGIARYPAWNGVSAKEYSCTTIADGNPDGEVWLPLECDTTIRRGWFWNKRFLETTKSLQHLMQIYYNTVGNGAVLLLNSNPDPKAVIPEIDVNRAKELGDCIRQLETSRIASASGEGDTLEIDLGELKSIDHIIIAEDIRHGERVRRYCVEGFIEGKWTNIVSGTAVGHKRIHPINEIILSKVRLWVQRYADIPMIKEFSVCFAHLPVDTKDFVMQQTEAVTIFQWGDDIFYGNGRVKDQMLSMNLTSFMTEEADVGQYEIKLLGSNGQPTITKAELFMDGVLADDLIKLGGKDKLIITIPGVEMNILLNITCDMPNTESSGFVTMEKM